MTKCQRVMYQPVLLMGENGTRITESAGHRELSKQAAKEGMVLLKNEAEALPLQTGTRVALFGKATFDYVKGGGGSGDVTVSYVKNLYEGFQELPGLVQVYEPLADFYRKDVQKQYQDGIDPGMTREPELTEELLQGARSFADTAIISICRFSGEGWDRKSTYDHGVKENLNIQVFGEGALQADVLFEEGDFYLANAERAMVQKVRDSFARVIVVMNVGGMVDTEWFAADERIQAVLMAWQGGMEGGRAAAELLCGIGAPSGKLSDTFAKRLEDYPSSCNFHESKDYVDYTEDIYVGYRYFETIPGAAKKVNYPFGYGLTYTSFEWRVQSFFEKEDRIQIRVSVINTGKRAGKEVFQAYVEAPQGKLGKPARVLAAFEKTRLLQPGETQMVTLEFSMCSLASYDDLGKVCASAYILEAGDYFFHIGTSVRETIRLEEIYSLKEDRVVQQMTKCLEPTSLSRRMLADGSYEELQALPELDPRASLMEPTPKDVLDWMAPSVRAVPGYHQSMECHKPGIRTFNEVAEGKMTLKEFLSQLADEELAHLLGGQPNIGVANTYGIGNMPEYGIPNVMTADGPAGLRIQPQCGVCTTAWPCATMLACSFNPEMVYQVGKAGAEEVKENNIAVWLTPAVNIHRSPLCGRNFEYYSEDPYLVGMMASAMVQGIQSQNIAASVKHFAFNNKETNRTESDSRVSERAAREIYLKGFELIVKHAKPWTIMSSYNIVNGCRTAESHELLTTILRQEWGFDGLVMTDWWCAGEHYKEVKAGNDLKMPVGLPSNLIKALEKGIITRQELETCAGRILKLILKLD